MADWRDLAAQNPRRIRPGQETIKRIAEERRVGQAEGATRRGRGEGDDWTSDEPRHDPAGCGDPGCDC